MSVIAKDLARAYGMTVKPAVNEQLLSVDDTAMDVAGYTRIAIKGVPIKAIVSNSVKDDILIGWRDLIRLDVIPESFPSKVCAATATCSPEESTIAKRQQALCEAYPDVLREELPEHALSGTPMRIELRDDMQIKPRQATTCKLTPTHLQEDAKKLLQSLLDDDIIE